MGKRKGETSNHCIFESPPQAGRPINVIVRTASFRRKLEIAPAMDSFSRPSAAMKTISMILIEPRSETE